MAFATNVWKARLQNENGILMFQILRTIFKS
jgi:hypothetical protein